MLNFRSIVDRTHTTEIERNKAIIPCRTDKRDAKNTYAPIREILFLEIMKMRKDLDDEQAKNIDLLTQNH